MSVDFDLILRYLTNLVVIYENRYACMSPTETIDLPGAAVLPPHMMHKKTKKADTKTKSWIRSVYLIIFVAFLYYWSIDLIVRSWVYLIVIP